MPDKQALIILNLYLFFNVSSMINLSLWKYFKIILFFIHQHIRTSQKFFNSLWLLRIVVDDPKTKRQLMRGINVIGIPLKVLLQALAQPIQTFRFCL